MRTNVAQDEPSRVREWPHASPPLPDAYRRPSSRTSARHGPRVDRTAPRHPDETAVAAFDLQAHLASSGLRPTIAHYERGDAVFRQGDVGQQVLVVQSGIVKLSVLSKTGREAVVALLGPGDVLGEGCLAGQRLRTNNAYAIAPSVVHGIDKHALASLLDRQPETSAGLLAHMLTRNIRMQEDLLDHIFNSCEKRLARTLLLLARNRGLGQLPSVVPRISQETLAEMVGTSRSRVNLFLNKFKRLGFIQYQGERPMQVNASLGAVLGD